MNPTVSLVSQFKFPGFPNTTQQHQVLDMDERVFFHLSDVLPDDHSSGGASAESVPEADGTTASNTNTNTSGSGSSKPIIRRGQEVAFRIGQRQNKPLGLYVRKLRPGTLPTEESLPCRFVGVVVVPPRNIGIDKEKVRIGPASRPPE